MPAVTIVSIDTIAMNRRSFIISAVTASSLALGLKPATAQDYPQRPVRTIVPYAAGGASDTLGRLLAARIDKDLGQPLVIDNRAGGASMIGTKAVATAAPDGYTIGFVDSAFMVNPGLFGAKVPYDTRKDFEPISLLAVTPLVLAVHPSSPVNNVRELVALAKSKPGIMTFGSGGLGSGLHLAGEQLRQVASIDVIHVPYRGGAPAVLDLIAGKIDYAFSTIPSILQQIQAGQAKPLGLTTDRIAQLPGVLALAEVGFPEVDAVLEIGLVAPARTPPEIVAKLNQIAVNAVTTEPLRQRMIDIGFVPVGSTPQAFRERIDREIDKWIRLIAAGNIKPDQ